MVLNLSLSSSRLSNSSCVSNSAFPAVPKTVAALLAQAAPFSQLPPAACQRLAAMLEVQPLQAKESYYLHDQHAPPDYLLALDGFIMLRKEPLKGSPPFALHLPPGLLWPTHHFNKSTVFTSIHTFEPSLLGKLSWSMLQRGLQETAVSPDSVQAVLRLALLQSLSLTLNYLTTNIITRADDSLSVQLARLLLQLQRCQNNTCVVPFTHQQLANLLAVNRETVSYTVGQFRDQCWIAQQRGCLTILDSPALQKVANGR